MPSTFATVELAFIKARDFVWGDVDDATISYLLANLLTDHNLVTDNQISTNSVEARVVKAFRVVQDSWEGDWVNHTDAVAEAICEEFGLDQAAEAA